MKKFIWLIRHGKSAWPAGVPDLERPLNRRGRRDGEIMAQVLAKQNEAPQAFYSSDSKRTRQTTALINGLLQAPVFHTHDLYTADCADVEQLLHNVEASSNSVAVVSHLPTIDSCISATQDRSEPKAIPTLASVCYAFSGPWIEMEFSRAQFKKLFIPRMFQDNAN